MQEQFYKLLKKKTWKVEEISSVVLVYEQMAKSADRGWEKCSSVLINDTFEVGIEIEVENVKAHACTEYPIWQVKQDNSLRNRGFEYVTFPIKGPRIIFALNQFFGTMAKDIHFSPRTSIHVHLNALDMTPAQVAGLVMTYITFEKLFYRFVGGDRDKNNFCVPMNDIKWDNIIRSFIGSKFEFPNLENLRYLGLNLGSLRKFGTLEFRHLGGTNDVVKIVRWINLLFALKMYATKRSHEEIRNSIIRLNSISNYVDFLNEVFPLSCQNHLTSPNLQRDLEVPASRIKKLTSENLFKIELQKETTKAALWIQRFSEKENKKEYLLGSRPQPRRIPTTNRFETDDEAFRAARERVHIQTEQLRRERTGRREPLPQSIQQIIINGEVAEQGAILWDTSLQPTPTTLEDDEHF